MILISKNYVLECTKEIDRRNESSTNDSSFMYLSIS